MKPFAALTIALMFAIVVFQPTLGISRENSLLAASLFAVIYLLGVEISRIFVGRRSVT